jgi:hypothetical protein
MVDFNGQKLKTNQEKEDAFFCKKDRKICLKWSQQ